MLWISPDRVGSAAVASEGEQLPQPRRSYLFPGICPQQGAGAVAGASQSAHFVALSCEGPPGALRHQPQDAPGRAQRGRARALKGYVLSPRGAETIGLDPGFLA